MRKLIYAFVYVLVLGFAACGSDDDVDCDEANVALSEAAVAYGENQNSTDVCNAYRMALETSIINGCFADDDEKEILEQELKRIGDCTFSGKTCLSCTNSEITLTICRGENGNAFIVFDDDDTEDKDTGIPFSRYIELSDCE